MTALLANFEDSSLITLALDRVAARVVWMGIIVVVPVAAGLGFHIARRVAR